MLIDTIRAHAKVSKPESKSELSTPLKEEFKQEPFIISVKESSLPLSKTCLNDLFEEEKKDEKYMPDFTDEIKIGENRWSALKEFAMKENYQKQSWYFKLNDEEKHQLEKLRSL